MFMSEEMMFSQPNQKQSSRNNKLKIKRANSEWDNKALLGLGKGKKNLKEDDQIETEPTPRYHDVS